jgi:hypothetical protein
MQTGRSTKTCRSTTSSSGKLGPRVRGPFYLAARLWCVRCIRHPSGLSDKALSSPLLPFRWALFGELKMTHISAAAQADKGL